LQQNKKFYVVNALWQLGLESLYLAVVAKLQNQAIVGKHRTPDRKITANAYSARD
jgi:hypothetical protein